MNNDFLEQPLFSSQKQTDRKESRPLSASKEESAFGHIKELINQKRRRKMRFFLRLF
ncbi:hypothetical protein SD77_2247 [Bacillus badius]|uniref:Mobile element protein n=1 Tax=Bacillus badius TaxID=1455 RepID=A0ABR5AYH9_BACBA|nr:hypothetical protein SD77_2247 [Bacillus badius]